MNPQLFELFQSSVNQVDKDWIKQRNNKLSIILSETYNVCYLKKIENSKFKM